MLTRRTLFIFISLLAGMLILRSVVDRLDVILAGIYHGFTSDTLVLPLWIDYAAVFVFGITGTMTARVKGYDFVGAFVLAGITAMGGALLRDGLCIQTDISPLFSDSGYIISLTAAWIFGMYLGEYLMRFDHFIVICDAAGLGLYAVFGTNKAMAYELSIPVAIGVGMINAIGGGLLRDVISREEPMVFKPGQFYTGVAVFSSVLFIALYQIMPPTLATLIVVIATIAIRLIVIHYNIHTQSVAATQDRVKRLLKAIREAHRPDAEDEEATRRFQKTLGHYDRIGRYDDDPVAADSADEADASYGNAVDPKEKL